MWKGRPVILESKIASFLDLADGKNGYTANSADEYGHKIIDLLESPSLATAIGQAARDHVKQRFLAIRLLQKYLTMLREFAYQPLT
jgi:glycosyltransferase involved in cell wall biosynthesis